MQPGPHRVAACGARWRTRWLSRPRPAGAPEASLSASSRPRLPQAPASLGQPVGRSGRAGQPHQPWFRPRRGAFLTIDRPYPPLIDWLHHRIGTTHVAHHIDCTIPHYHAREATDAIAAAFPKAYLYDPTPIHIALHRSRLKAPQLAAPLRPSIACWKPARSRWAAPLAPRGCASRRLKAEERLGGAPPPALPPSPQGASNGT